MSAYVIVNVDVHDQDRYDEYRKLVPATLEKYGGKFLARGGAIELLEGDWSPTRLVVLEFDSIESARRWHDSVEYAGPMAIRKQSARTDMVVVEGV
jgi:uncharacterized protein (DUF1330 family)